MAHKVLIGGTEYNVVGGRTCIGGTGYDVIKGRSLISATGYDINFASTPLQDFIALMGDATLQTSASRNNGSTGTVALLGAQASDRYIFAFCDGAWSVSRDGTNIYHSDAQKGWSRVDYGGVYLSNDGGSTNAAVYGGSLFSFTFPSHTTTEADAIIANIMTKDSAGVNQSTTGRATVSASAGDTVIAATQSYMGLSSPIGTVIYGNHSTNPSLIYFDGSAVDISTTGISYTQARGATVAILG